MIDHAQMPSPSEDPRPGRKASRIARKSRHMDLLGDLAQPTGAPDLTRSIMGRLGYMRVPPMVSRRHRMRRIAGRLGMLCATVFAMGLGAKMYLESPQARRPADVTIPSAIDSDLQRHGAQFDSMIRTIRNLSPVQSPSSESHDADDVREGIDDDVNYSSVGPVRWV